ncbi:MAG TPA: O-methyltransferase [Eubacteriaceae bacterium]|nr:O-methyltransferase [Eubacteriaceae bacterium]
MNYINQEYIEHYIQGLLPKPSPFLKKMEDRAEKLHIPIIHPEVSQFITLLLKGQNCKNLLEVGTAIGYSAIIFSKAMGKDSRVVTIEREREMIHKAKENIKEAGLEDNITILGGEAGEILPTLTDSFDCIFLDGAKGHYLDFLPNCLKLLKDNGLLISDNVLFRGMIASDKLVKRRKITIVKRMRKYLAAISHHPQLKTSIIPLGDGLAISLKGGNKD